MESSRFIYCTSHVSQESLKTLATNPRKPRSFSFHSIIQKWMTHPSPNQAILFIDELRPQQATQRKTIVRQAMDPN